MGHVLGGGGSSNAPEKLFGVKVNSSDLGKPVTVIMGTARTNQKLFWIDGFTASQQSSGKKGGGGGGKGGGKGGGNYIYSANVIAGLCAGPILGIGDAWSGQSWLGSPIAAESYVIAGPSYSYTPTNAGALVNNYGVSPTSTYTSSYPDYGSPAATSVGNRTAQPYSQLEYGSSLDSGEYSVDPNTGTYYFSSANAGTTVKLSYSFLLTTINQQENDLVPSGLTLAIGGSQAFNADLGVTYGGTGTNSGKALARVNGTPSAAGTYSITGSAPATYRFASADIGAQVSITYQITNPNQVGQNESTMLDFTLAEGYIGQAPHSFLTGSYPGAALGYSGVANILYEPMDFGMGGVPQQNSFEVITPDAYGGVYESGHPILDCNPVHCMTRVLTDTQWGLGVGAQPFPPSFIDNGVGGTWGEPCTPSVQSVNSSAFNWFAANNFFISPQLDSQDSAGSTMSKWLEAGMCASFVSEGLLKLAPYGDTTQAANGCTWTAPASYVVALDDTCFIAKEGADPVSIKRSAWQDAFNAVQVQWDSRGNQYSKEVTEESDQSLSNRYGSRIEDPQDWSFIHTLSAATFAANMRLKHGTYIRNTYEFALPFTYSYLEPMDLVTITTSSVWAQGLNNTNLGVVNLPIRITKIVDDPIEGLKIEAEDYPFGAGQPTLYNKGLSAAEVVSDPLASPGTSEVVLFEATGRLTGYQGNQLWIGACGTGTNYGSTNVWVSQDAVNYVNVTPGGLSQPAVIGELVSAFPAGSDPDTTHSLVVQLAENSAPLSSGTTQAADNDTMLCYVGGEVISYSAAAISGQNTYTMGGYIRRGQLGTTIGSHAIGSLFMRLDGSIFKYTYDPTWEGKTVYFKFQAVNNFGNNPQPLSNLSAVSFTIGTGNTATVDAETGLVDQAAVAGLPTTITGINSNVATAQSTATSAQTTATAAQLAVSALTNGAGNDYLTPSEKATLIAQWGGEHTTQTTLDALASSLSVSTTYYDNSIAAVSTALIAVGAPSDWATTWPDGTTSGPWTDIVTNLANLWAAVAIQRTTLQSAISYAQAAAAQAAAVSIAATNAASVAATAQATAIATSATNATAVAATAQANAISAAATNAASVAATAQSNAIAAANTAAHNAQTAAVATAAAMGASESIVPNGGFTTGDATGWSIADVGTTNGTFGTLPNGAKGITVPGGGNASISSPAFQVIPGKKYKFIFWAYSGSGVQSVYLRVNVGEYAAPNITSTTRSGVLDYLGEGSITTSGVTYYTYDWTPTDGQNYASMCVYEYGNGNTAPIYVQGLFCIPYVQAAYIDAGAVTAASIAAGTITGDKIAANSITAGQIAAGAIGADQLAANSITAANLTVMDFTNLCYNPGFEDGAAQWGGDIGAPPLAAFGHTGTKSVLLPNGGGTYATYNQNRVPCAPGQTFLLQCYALASAVLSSGNFGLRVQYFDAAGASANGADWNFIPTTAWAPYSTTMTIPAGVYFVRCAYVSWGVAGGDVYLDDFYFRRCDDASLIVDGAITSAKIATGAITADMITTGTLDASAVTVTNLNAGNITTGTLSAAKVAFVDGTSLTTAKPAESFADQTINHVAGQTFVFPPCYTLIDVEQNTDLVGISFTLSSALDFLYIFCNVLGTGYGSTFFVSAHIDGNVTPFPIVASTTGQAIAVLTGVVSGQTLLNNGLGLGTHTLTITVSTGDTGYGFATNNSSVTLMQFAGGTTGFLSSPFGGATVGKASPTFGGTGI